MHPASTASLRVASSSFAVMKMTGHFVPDAASRRCSSIPEIPPRWMSSSRQVPICALPLSSNASAEANVRLSMPLCANSRATPFRKPCGVRIEGQSSQVEVGLFVCSCAGAAGVAEIVATPTRISLYGDGERCGYPRSAGCATIYRCFRGDISEELTMTKSILISLAVLTLSTSAALAAHRTHHRQAMNASASVGASPVIWMGGVSSSDRALYIKNLHDSGYNLKDNFSANGNIKG